MSSLVLWSSVLALMMWRWPDGDRFHLPACLVGSGIWSLLPLLEPSMRSWPYVVVCLTVLVIALLRDSTEAMRAERARAGR